MTAILERVAGAPVPWHCVTELRKWHTQDDTAHLWRPADELEVIDGNILVFGGASLMWQYALGNGVTTADQALTFLNNARAAIGVGDSSTAQAQTQTDLQGAANPANKIRKAMDATYPLHTDGVTTANDDIVLRSSFLTGEANFVWNEWAIFNSVTQGSGRMLNRKVQALGTKTSGTWQLTVTLTLA